MSREAPYLAQARRPSSPSHVLFRRDPGRSERDPTGHAERLKPECSATRPHLAPPETQMALSPPVSRFPPELLSAVCARVFACALPASPSSLDPLCIDDQGGYPPASSLPSSFPAANWSETSARRTLAALCLVNHAWFAAAKPWLWRRVEVRLPLSWLALLDEITPGDDDALATSNAALVVGPFIWEATQAAVHVEPAPAMQSLRDAAEKLRLDIVEELTGPSISIPAELLSPAASREPSPRRPRTQSKSPTRWRLMRTISDAVLNVISRKEPNLYFPPLQDTHPGRHVRHLDFNHFRTIGMLRSVDEGIKSRFVTGDRLEELIKEMPNLISFGATEYMDGALTLNVLKELLLRGSASRLTPETRGRATVAYQEGDREEEERWGECLELEGLDLTGCISAVFVSALEEFVRMHVAPTTLSGRSTPRSGTATPTPPRKVIRLSGLRRLCLRGAKSIQSHVLDPLILSMPNLTHLDLSCTRVGPDLLDRLGASSTIRLRSISLERCTRLTGESILTFLVMAPAARDIVELNLYGDGTFSSPLSRDDLVNLFAHAPCFTSGKLVYLDLSSAPLDREALLCMPAQSHLRSLGFSHLPGLDLSAVATFLTTKAPGVEVLTLVGTSPQLGHGQVHINARQANLALHMHLVTPLCVPPFSLASAEPAPQAATRLRVIELSKPVLSGIGTGAGSWRVVRSKGGRGWYVDTASGWVTEPGTDTGLPTLRRDLPKDHLWRVELERVADANGNVSSGVGWHARKMEVLHGHGMLGREDGLYGAVAFAYQG